MMERSSDSHEPSNWNSFEASINSTIRMYNLMYPPVLQDAIRSATLAERLRAAYEDTARREELVAQAEAELTDAPPKLRDAVLKLKDNIDTLSTNFDKFTDEARQQRIEDAIMLASTMLSYVGDAMNSNPSASPAYVTAFLFLLYVFLRDLPRCTEPRKEERND